MRRPLYYWVACAGFVVWVVIGAIQWLCAAPLGHDEAQYAIAAIDFLDGEPPRWFNAPPLMNAIAIPGVLLEAAEVGLRGIPFVIGVVFVGAVGLVARDAMSPATAAWTLAVLAGCRSLVQRSTELLSDIPAAACVLLAMWIVVTDLAPADDSRPPRWRIVWVAPLLAAAFYVRYASVIPIGVLVLAATVVWWRAMLHAPWRIVATASLFALLVAPHAYRAVVETGSPIGLLIANDRLVGGSHGDALVTYVTQRDPFKYYGLLAPPLLVVGLVSIVWARRQQRVVFVWLVGVSSFLGMGLLTHGQPRYVFLGTTLLVMLGVDALRRYVQSLAPRLQLAIGALACCAVVAAWASATRKALRYPTVMRARLGPTLRASAAIRADARRQPCHVHGRYATRLEWYSGCSLTGDISQDALARGELVYVVLEPGDDEIRQPTTIVYVDPEVRVLRVERR